MAQPVLIANSRKSLALKDIWQPSISNTLQSATNLIEIEIEQVSLNGEFGHAWSKNVILDTAKGAPSVWTDFQTCGWEIAEINLKIRI